MTPTSKKVLSLLEVMFVAVIGDSKLSLQHGDHLPCVRFLVATRNSTPMKSTPLDSQKRKGQNCLVCAMAAALRNNVDPSVAAHDQNVQVDTKCAYYQGTSITLTCTVTK